MHNHNQHQKTLELALLHRTIQNQEKVYLIVRANHSQHILLTSSNIFESGLLPLFKYNCQHSSILYAVQFAIFRNPEVILVSSN